MWEGFSVPDWLRLRAEVHEPDRASVKVVISRLELRNPFQGGPYWSDARGRFPVGADYDETRGGSMLVEILSAEPCQ